MKYFLPGFLAGIILNMVFLDYGAAIEIYPEFLHDLRSIHREAVAGDDPRNPVKFFLKMDDHFYRIGADGRIVIKNRVENVLTSFSGDGEYYVRYEKAGPEIELYNISGDKFWKIKSFEYPFLSSGGKIVLLLNGDQSNVRIFDRNGNAAGAGSISGKLATVICFSTEGDMSGIGFADGSYHVLNDRGMPVHRGRVPAGNVVKSMSVSGNGLYTAVHYGESEKDFLRIDGIGGRSSRDITLREVHPVRTPLHVSGSGATVIVNSRDITRYRQGGKTDFVIQIHQRKYGFSGVAHQDGYYSATYALESGGSRIIVFSESGNVVFSKEYPGEAFLYSSITRGYLFLRGSGHIYCYSLHGQARR